MKTLEACKLYKTIDRELYEKILMLVGDKPSYSCNKVVCEDDDCYTCIDSYGVAIVDTILELLRVRVVPEPTIWIRKDSNT